MLELQYSTIFFFGNLYSTILSQCKQGLRSDVITLEDIVK
jgi:hypothetical protein